MYFCHILRITCFGTNVLHMMLSMVSEISGGFSVRNSSLGMESWLGMECPLFQQRAGLFHQEEHTLFLDEASEVCNEMNALLSGVEVGELKDDWYMVHSVILLGAHGSQAVIIFHNKESGRKVCDQISVNIEKENEFAIVPVKCKDAASVVVKPLGHKAILVCDVHICHQKGPLKLMWESNPTNSLLMIS